MFFPYARVDWTFQTGRLCKDPPEILARVGAGMEGDLHSINRITTPSGNVRYDGSSKDGHADRFWALALGYHASTLKVYTKIEWFTSSAKRLFSSGARVFGRRSHAY